MDSVYMQRRLLSYFESIIIENEILLYPNPAIRNISIEVKSSYKITITNIEGQIVQTLNINSGKTIIYLDEFSSGIYLIEGVNDESSFTKELVIEI